MANRDHEWVEQFRIYEAVLCCSHDLRAWDKEETLRAYQTFGFDDATTDGNDLSFRHIDTGVMILHDGGVVAIQFGGGEMVSAMADLFTTLEALGWKKAEIYHPEETLDALLSDMGKAIPGHLDFDVVPAPNSSSSAELSAEAQEMVDIGRSLMVDVASSSQEVDQFNQAAMAELKSMTGDDQFAQSNGRGQAHQEVVPLATALQLDDEDGLENYAQGSVALKDGPMPQPNYGGMPAQHSDRIFVDDEDSLPIVPVLNATVAKMEPVLEHPFPAPVAIATDDPETHEAGVQDNGYEARSAAVVHADPLPVQHPPHAYAPTELQTLVQQHLAPPSLSFSVMKLGRSAICFDLPAAATDQTRIDAICNEMQISEVVDVWPGLTKQQERWDLLGEIDPASPWFAETIADELKILMPVERILFAGALKNAAAEGLQVRDLLMKLIDGVWAPDALVKAAQTSVDSSGLTQSVFEKLGALLLSEDGEAFLDTKARLRDADEENYSEPIRIFSARLISQDPQAKLYVVHLDACDGPFVQTLVTLMMEVFQRYACSMRNIKVAESQRNRALALEAKDRETKRQEEERQAVLRKAHETLGQILTSMKEAGVDAEQMMAMFVTN